MGEGEKMGVKGDGGGEEGLVGEERGRGIGGK